jgi:hypothetical protein
MVLMGGLSQKRRKLLLALLLALMIGVVVSCGGSGGSHSNPAPQTDPGTTSGTYSLKVVASSGSDSHTISIPVTVQ